MNNYLLEGTDYVAIKAKIDELIKKNGFDNALVSNYDGEINLLEEILEDLDTYGFLSSKKVIIVKGFDNLDNNLNEKDINHLIKYLKNPSPDNLLFLIVSKSIDKNIFIKKTKKYLDLITISLNAVNFIKQQLRDYKLEQGVVRMLDEYALGDITKLKNDCDKLKQYKYDTKEIAVVDVLNSVTKKLGDAKDKTFEFTRCLAKRNKKQALIYYQELLNYNIEPLSIIGLLASQIRIMYQVKILSKKRMSNDEIAKVLEEKSSYRISKTKELIDYYTEEELLSLMIKLSDMDLEIKTTDIDSKFLIEMLIINL